VNPYSTNRMRVTQNTADFLFMQGANGDDPIVRYALVGKTIEEGLFAWIRFGVNTQANKPVSPAAWWTENGGVMNPNGPVGGGGGGFPGVPGGGWPGGKKAKRAAAAAAAAEKWEVEEDSE
jgi:hypothetical protein